MNLDSAFRERLRWALESRSATQSDLARALDISPQAVQQWANGITTSPRRDKLAKAAEFLGVRLEWLAYARGPMRQGESADGSAPAPDGVDAALLSREWEDALLAALPEHARASWSQSVTHPVGSGRLRVDWVSDSTVAELALYRSPAALIAGARSRLLQLLVARAVLPPVPGRRAVLLLAPLESWRDVPQRHIDAIAAEARAVGAEAIHAETPEAAAAVLLGKAEAPAIPVEEDLGLDSGPVL